jgi:hypothetical protein
MKKQSRSIARKSASIKKAPAKVSRRKVAKASATASPVRTVARKATKSVAGTLKKLMAR